MLPVKSEIFTIPSVRYPGINKRKLHNRSLSIFAGSTHRFKIRLTSRRCPIVSKIERATTSEIP